MYEKKTLQNTRDETPILISYSIQRITEVIKKINNR